MIAFINWSLLHLVHLFNPNFDLSLNWIFGKLFYPFAWAMGVPAVDVNSVATLLGQKLTINEFVAFSKLTSHQMEYNFLALPQLQMDYL